MIPIHMVRKTNEKLVSTTYTSTQPLRGPSTSVRRCFCCIASEPTEGGKPRLATEVNNIRDSVVVGSLSIFSFLAILIVECVQP
jgi:hypothetical protein